MKALATTLAMLFALTACGSSTDDDDPPPSDLQTVIEDAPSDDIDMKVIGRQALREQQPSLTAGISDEQIDTLAETVCGAWDAGASPEDMVLASMADGIEAEAGSVMALAAIAYCPEHKDQLDSFANSY